MINAETALGALLLSAQIAGVDPSGVTMPPAFSTPGGVEAPEAADLILPRGGRESAQPQAIGRIALDEIGRRQDRAYRTRPVGRGAVDFSAAIGPGYEIWPKFRQGGVTRAHPMTALQAGVVDGFPVEAYRFSAASDTVRAAPVGAPATPEASATVGDLLGSLYASAGHVVIDPVRYALLYEDGSLAPPSVGMVRRDSNGIFWLSYVPIGQLRDFYWFLGVDGTIYAMRVEGRDLVFYAKPVPALKSRAVAAAEIPFARVP